MSNGYTSSDREGGISAAEEEVYDRQLRLWGIEAQKRINSSKILIFGLSGIHVEMAKNLALAGFSIHILDDSLIHDKSLEYNFLLHSDDKGLKAGEIFATRLRELNPLVSVSFEAEESSKTFAKLTQPLGKLEEEEVSTLLQPYAAVCISLECYRLHTLVALDKICRNEGKAFFCSLSCGKFGFFLSDMHKHIVEESFGKEEAHQPSSRDVRSPQTASSHAGQCARKEIFNFPLLEEVMDCRLGAFRKKIDPLFYSFFALFKWLKERGAFIKHPEIYEPLSEGGLFDDFIIFAKNLYEEDRLLGRQNLEQLARELSQSYGVQFLPTAAIMGGFLAQEVRKFVSKQHEPLINCSVFNMDTLNTSVARIP